MTMTDSDHLFLREAIELAAGGRFTTAPNPCVGCVIVKQGQILGRGFHVRPGEGHAEVNALQDAHDRGHDVRGSTVYVSLEPCAFVGRTPACARTLVEAQVARVVIAMLDPHPKVAGQGVAILRDHGIEVVVRDVPEAQPLVRGYVKRVTRGLPWIRIKTASSLDGAVALADGQSKWITGPPARQDVQYWRASVDAIITGVGTVLADNPGLTVRDPAFEDAPQPLRVVLDRQLRTPVQAQLCQDGHPTLLAHAADVAVPEQLSQSAQLSFHALAPQDPLSALLQHLAELGCNDVLVEAGPQLVGSFLAADLWDEWISYLAPKWLGDQSRQLAAFDLPQLADAPSAKVVDVRRFGEDVRLILERP